MDTDTAYNLGPFRVDREGRIAPRVGAAMPNVLFQWRGRAVQARMEGHDTDGSLAIATTLGRVPSTADPVCAALRPLSLAILRGLPETLPARWRIQLLPDHQARLEAQVAMPWPVTAVALVTELTRFLLALAPYLDLLDEACIGGHSTASGAA
jgi:hypothetical protein